MKNPRVLAAALLLLIFALISPTTTTNVYAQSGFRFKHYTTVDGLPTNFVGEIIQDGQGYMWFRHQFELSRFDGYNFKVYRNNPDDSLLNLGQNLLGDLLVDRSGNLWINNIQESWQSGFLIKYDKKIDGFVQYKPDLKGAFINSIAFDKKQPLIWLAGRYGRGLFSFNMESFETKGFINSDTDSLTLKLIGAMQDRGTYLLLGTLQGLWTFNKTTKTFRRPKCNPKDSTLLFYSPIGVVDQDENDNHWMYKPGDVTTFFRVDSSYTIIQRFDLPEGFTFVSLSIDKAGNFWFSTSENGLYQYDQKNGSLINIKNIPGDPFSLKDNELRDVTVDNEQNIWVAVNKGVSKLQNKSVQFHRSYVAPQSLGCNEFRSLKTKDGTYLLGLGGNNTLWMASFSLRDSLNFKPFKFEEPDKPWSNFIKSWMGKSHFWMATWGRGVIGLPINQKTGMVEHGPAKYLSHDPKNSNTLSTNNTWSIYEDEDENLWVGTFSGMNRVNPRLPYGEKGSVVRYNHDPKDSNSISHDIVRQILSEDETSFWVATEVGVDLFQKSLEMQGGKFEHSFKNRETVSSIYKTLDGTLFVGTEGGLYDVEKKGSQINFSRSPIFSEVVYSLTEDQLGRLWFAGYNGIVCYDRKRQIAIRLTEQDGLHDSEGFLFQIENGILVYSNGESISAFDPTSLVISEKKVIPTLTSLNVNNRPPIVGNGPFGKDDFKLVAHVSTLDELALDYLHNNFSLEFSAIEMTAPEKNLYRHKLEGYDPDWVETNSKNRTATYTNLPAGDYTFRVKASNHHGVWSDQERTLKVKILPPPWKTAWAYAGYTLIVLGLLFMARRMIVQRERLKGSLTIAKVEQEKEHFELEKAKEVDRVKTSFFTNISHEFRTPLTLIKGPVETLLDRFKDDPDVAQRLKLVQRNSEVLLRLINQLLDLAKLESGTMKIEKSSSDINSFIRAIAGSFESLARHKNVTLSVEISSERNQVIFDKDKLETILINLINNAIKFTPSGGKVQVQATCSDNSLTMMVRDTGIGIPIDHQQKIFERFHQVSEAHKEIGTGIGLSLVKELIQLLEGTITVNSEPGKGTTFTVTIRVEDGTESTETAEEELAATLSADHGHSNNQFHTQPSHNGAPERPHVLVVEDNDDLRAFIMDSLGQEFYFLEADNGRNGLEVATTDIPDLIISDVMMPEMDGITMASKIKTDHRSSHIPLILLTAKSTEDSKLQGLKSGADDYLTKPFNREELLLKVRNSISRQIKLRERLRAEVMSSAPAVEVMSEDERFLVNVKEKILERLSDEQLSVESLAEDIGISRVHLYRKVSGLTGLSANELIRKLRLQRAAQLIEQHWGPVSQVAYEVGFSNLSYFSKVFKEEFGVLPSEHRQIN